MKTHTTKHQDHKEFSARCSGRLSPQIARLRSHVEYSTTKHQDRRREFSARRSGWPSPQIARLRSHVDF